MDILGENQNNNTACISDNLNNANELLRNEINELEILNYLKDNQLKERLLEFEAIKNNFLAEKDALLNKILETNLAIANLQKEPREISVESNSSCKITCGNDQSDCDETPTDNNTSERNKELLKKGTSSTKCSSDGESEYCAPVRRKQKDASKNAFCHNNVKVLLSKVEVGKVISLQKIGASLKTFAKTYFVSQSDVGMHVMGLSAPRTSDFIHHSPPSFEKASIVEKENYLKMFHFLTNKTSLQQFWKNCKKRKGHHFTIKVLKRSDLYE